MAENHKISTAKEAIIAELFGDISDAVLKLDEALDKSALVEKELSLSTKALTLASKQYKDTVNTFTEEAKSDITRHIERETAEHTAPVLKRLTEQNNKALNGNIKAMKAVLIINTILIVTGLGFIIMLLVEQS